MQTVVNKLWQIVFVSLIVGACIGAAAIESVTLLKKPQQVAVTTKSQGKCVISNGRETHVNQCQIIASGIAYINY